MTELTTKLTRDRIVAAAYAAVAKDGYDELRVRRLADDLDVTAPALYDHFDSRAQLLTAVADLGFARLFEDALQVNHPRAIERVRRRSIRYVEFAGQNPGVFALMFRFRPSSIDVVDQNGAAVAELDSATESFEVASADLRRAIEDGDIVDQPADELALMLWGAIHGVALIGTSAPELAVEICQSVIDIMLAGLRPSMATTP